MPALPLAHVSWAVADNALRAHVDGFFLDVLGAETVFEMLVAEGTGFDREERLMVIGDTMLIPIAPAGAGLAPDSPIGTMLRRQAVPGRWLGIALRVAELAAADAWFRARGFKLHYDPGVEDRYFLIGPRQALGMRLELMVGELPNDPRLKPGWRPQRWRDDHPLGIEGLQSIGLSTASLAEAKALFEGRLEWPLLSERHLPGDDADVAAFLIGDTVLEAMQPRADGSPLAAHARDVTGIYCLTFKVRSAEAAAEYLRGRGFELTGDVDDRFAIAPEQAHGRLIYFTERTVAAYPPFGSTLTEPGRLPPG